MSVNNGLANRPDGMDFSSGVEPLQEVSGLHWQIPSQNIWFFLFRLSEATHELVESQAPSMTY